MSGRLPIVYAAAHAGFDLSQVALGGGAAVAEALIQHWSRDSSVELTVLGAGIDVQYPSGVNYMPVLSHPPRNTDLIDYSELRYAKFCREFGSAVTEWVQTQAIGNRQLAIGRKQLPTAYCPLPVVLMNDISEAGDFAALNALGYPLATIYHVDVVDYFCRYYLKGLRPEKTTAFYRGLEKTGLAHFLPHVLKLVFAKQAASVRYSDALIVPSSEMVDVLERCYPGEVRPKAHVLPWGNIRLKDVSPPHGGREVSEGGKRILGLVPSPTLPQGERDFTLMTLSRLSPEKGIHRILGALLEWEHRAPQSPLLRSLHLIICGAPAYMNGRRYDARLKSLAAKLKHARVHFPGYVYGDAKTAWLNRADLFISASEHESYGLTIQEALAAAVPVLAVPHYGAKDQVSGVELLRGDPDQAQTWITALESLLKDREHLRAIRRSLKENPPMGFPDAADRLRAVLAKLVR